MDYLFDLNRDDRRRHEILGLEYPPKSTCGGTESFDNATVEQIRTLISEKFLDPEECQNCSPSAQEFLDFMEKWPDHAYAHGYIVVPERDDYRVTIEGIGCKNVCENNLELANDFSNLCHRADEFSMDKSGFYSWWD